VYRKIGGRRLAGANPSKNNKNDDLSPLKNRNDTPVA